MRAAGLPARTVRYTSSQHPAGVAQVNQSRAPRQHQHATGQPRTVCTLAKRSSKSASAPAEEPSDSSQQSPAAAAGDVTQESVPAKPRARSRRKATVPPPEEGQEPEPDAAAADEPPKPVKAPRARRKTAAFVEASQPEVPAPAPPPAVSPLYTLEADLPVPPEMQGADVARAEPVRALDELDPGPGVQGAVAGSFTRGDLPDITAAAHGEVHTHPVFTGQAVAEEDIDLALSGAAQDPSIEADLPSIGGLGLIQIQTMDRAPGVAARRASRLQEQSHLLSRGDMMGTDVDDALAEGYGQGAELGLAEDGPERELLRQAIGHDIYREARLGAAKGQGELPEHLKAQFTSVRQKFDQEFQYTREYWMRRELEYERILDIGFEYHHRSREQAVNIYANTRRVAGLMTQFDADDFRLQNNAPSHVAPWVRAEIVFGHELEQFNQYLRDSTAMLSSEQPEEAAEEELDLMDEALFLLQPDDNNAAAARADQQTAEQDLLGQYLEGTLPGATLNSLAATYADEIYDGDNDAYSDVYEDMSAKRKAAADDSAAEDSAADESAAEEPAE